MDFVTELGNKMKFKKFTSEESDGSNTWECVIQKRQISRHSEIKVWHNDLGHVEIVCDDQILAQETFPVRGKEATQEEARHFVYKYFADLSNSIKI